MKIKNYVKWLLLVAIMPMFAACSWEELPAYEDANIEGAAFYFRYISNVDKDPITGEGIVKNGSLTANPVNIDTEAGTVEVTLRATKTNFREEGVFDSITLENLVGTVTLSTAARIAPTDNHKVLGVPDDWSTPHSFVVTAANGTKKTWTITVVELKK